MHTEPCTGNIKQGANDEHYRLDSLRRQLKPVMVSIEPPVYKDHVWSTRAHVYM